MSPSMKHVGRALRAYQSLEAGAEAGWSERDMAASIAAWARHFGLACWYNPDEARLFKCWGTHRCPASENALQNNTARGYILLNSALEDFARYFEVFISKTSYSVTEAEALTTLWLSAGYLGLSPEPKHHLGGNIWKCLQESRHVMIRHDLKNYAMWCEWYTLCARAFEHTNQLGCYKALKAAASLEQKLGKHSKSRAKEIESVLLAPKAGASKNDPIEKALLLFLEKPAWPLRRENQSRPKPVI